MRIVRSAFIAIRCPFIIATKECSLMDFAPSAVAIAKEGSKIKRAVDVVVIIIRGCFRQAEGNVASCYYLKIA